jgi:ABC-type branched-subunit amino acid transport system permease subunit
MGTTVFEWLKNRENHPFTWLRNSLLCHREVPPTTARQVIGWWEARRIPFNLVVGSAGLVSCIVVGVVALGSYFLYDSELGMPDPPLFALFGILIYGIAANVCFTGGWITELIIRQIWPAEADRFATLSLSLGLVFSVLLTLSPALVVGAAGIFEVMGHVFGVVHKPGS